MERYDPLEGVNQLRAWVEKLLSSLNTDRLAEARARYRQIMRVIDRLEKRIRPALDSCPSALRPG